MAENMCYVRGRSDPFLSSVQGSAAWLVGAQFLEFTDTSKKEMPFKTKQMRHITCIEALCVSLPTNQLAAVGFPWGSVHLLRAPQNGQWFTHVGEFYSSPPPTSMVSHDSMRTSLLVATAKGISSRDLTSSFASTHICDATRPKALTVLSPTTLAYAEGKTLKIWDVIGGTLAMEIKTEVTIECIGKRTKTELFVGGYDGIDRVDLANQKVYDCWSPISVSSLCSSDDLLVTCNKEESTVNSFIDLSQPDVYVQTRLPSCIKVTPVRDVVVVTG